MNLFQTQEKHPYLHINCKALTDEDWNSIAFLLSKKLSNFKRTIGVPKSGKILAEKMEKYATDKDSLPTLICDDTLISSASLNKFKSILQASESYGGVRYVDDKFIGAVAFLGGKCPQWVTPLIKM